MIASLRRLGPYVYRYRTTYAIGSLCVIASVALRFLVPWLLGDSIDVLRRAASAGDVTAADSDRLTALILVAAGWMVLAAVVGAVIRTLSRLTILGNSRKAVHDVRTDLFERLLRLAPSFYVRHRTGHIMSRCVNDMQNVQGLLGPVFMYLVETAVLFGVGLVFMVAADPWLTLIGIAPFPLFLWLAKRLAQQVQEGSRISQEQLGELSAKVDESLSGLRVIRTMGLEAHDLTVFDAHAAAYSATQVRLARVRATLATTMTFLAALSSFLVLAFGAPRVADGSVTVGEIVSLMLYLGLLAAPTRTLGFVLSSLQRGAAALERVGELLDMPVAIDDPLPHARTAPSTSARIEVRGLTVEFPAADEVPHLRDSLPPNGVSGRRRVLHDVSLVVPAGATLGVVGPVGSGKSTLLRAIARQIEVEPGQIFLDGRDITTEWSLDALRETVGTAPQDAFLFSDTLLENVRFGRPTASRETVGAAIELARLDQDLDQLPDGVDTMLGERGVNLSGGQRQRTSLARVAVSRPAVLLLDDTLSAVDTQTADAILQRLRPWMRERTTIVVAHRLNTVRDADQIVVLEDGRITERGTHDELLAARGYYASVWARQVAREGYARELGLPETEL